MESIDPYYRTGDRQPARGRNQGRGGNLRVLVDRQRQRRAEAALAIEPAVVGDRVLACLRVGRAVLLSTTSDGGAVSVTLYDGDDRRRSYCSDEAEFAEALAALTE